MNPHMHKDEDDDDIKDMLPLMTKKSLREAAVAHGGYESPALNDQLYLHYKGYRRIENLDAYNNLKALWLDSNGLQCLENLEHLKDLRSLFIQRNLLTQVGSGLKGLIHLVHLDLSENKITVINGLESLPLLEILTLSKNKLETASSIAHLTKCHKIATLDLSHNHIAGEDSFQVLTEIPQLVSLHMAGNPLVREVSHFRKRMIVKVKKLRFLDSPIKTLEREKARKAQDLDITIVEESFESDNGVVILETSCDGETKDQKEESASIRPLDQFVSDCGTRRLTYSELATKTSSSDAIVVPMHLPRMDEE